MTRARRFLASTAAALSVLLCVPVAPVRAADPVPPFIPPSAGWLETVNYYRTMSGLAPVTENAALNPGAYNHSCYMLYNGISHDELPTKPGYTSNGDIAGNSGNVAVSSALGATARSHIELWMTGPFHAIGILRYNLNNVGFGKCDLASTPTSWHSGATLNVLSGLVSAPRPATPILFPGDGTTTNLSAFITESPNPLDFCGWTGSAGLPVIAMMPETVTAASATMTGPTGPVPVSSISKANTTGTAQAILDHDNAVSVIPRAALTPGTYTVTVTTQARTVTWSFTVDPTASTGIMPLPTVVPSGAPSSYTHIAPFRFADSRETLRISPVIGTSIKMIKLAGIAGLPSDITAISANFTFVKPNQAGYLTVYDCTDPRPVASTLNYTTGAIVANAGVFPVSPSGYICIYSMGSGQLVIDISGYFRTARGDSFTATTPTPVFDTISGLNSSGRLGAHETASISFANRYGVPDGATAVAIAIAGINPAADGFITTYPCTGSKPFVSSVNPVVGSVRSNFAIVPLSAIDEMCLYTLTAEDVKVTLLGYFTTSGTGSIVPTTPTRVIDTRDLYRPDMNAGTDGQYLPANTTVTVSLAGHRGIPGSVKALSLNLTVANTVANGTLKIWGCGAEPASESVNFPAGTIIASGLQVKVGTSGEICLRSSTQLHVIVDVTGWWN